MHPITIQLEPETERRLQEKAAQAGQSLEELVRQIAREAAGTANGIAPNAAEEDDEGPGQRPWRGVLALPRERAVLFSEALSVDSLPKRPPSANLSWLRDRPDDE
jgi:plasmid stability protein